MRHCDVCCAGGASSRILNQPGDFATCDISRIEFGINLNLMGAIYMAKSLAMELGKFGINVTIVSPGPIMTRPGMASGNTYLLRCGQPEKVASLICYLASDEADFITGHNFIIDGGRCLGGLPYGKWFKEKK